MNYITHRRRHMQEDLWQKIKEFNMTRDQALAWKMAILYVTLAKEHFPDYHHCRLPRGDPRKSSLFKHCYSVTRKTAGKLDPHEYRDYITAQFQILKNIDLDNRHPMIDVNCLVGRSAWNRWLLWNRKIKNSTYLDTNNADIDVDKVKKVLLETKEFLLTKFSELTKRNIIMSLESRTMFRWCALGQVSGYYLALSPVVKGWLATTKTNLLENFVIDISVYKVNSDVEEYFREVFDYEF